MNQLSEDELGQSYSQCLARAAAAHFDLAPYEPRLTSPVEQLRRPVSQPRTDADWAEFIGGLVEFRLIDLMGRVRYSADNLEGIRAEALGEILSHLPHGVYYMQGINPTGDTITKAVSYGR